MKKNVISLSILVLLLTCLESCASKFVEITPDMGPVAIMSINMSNQLTWEGDDQSGKSLAKFATDKLINNKVEDEKALAFMGYTKPLFDDAIDACYGVIEKELNCPVVSQEELFAVPEYSEGKSDLALLASTYDTPEGYRALSERNSIAPVVATKTGAKSFLYITFDVCKVMSTGIGKNGACKGSVKTTATLADENGKVICRYYSYTTTEKSVAAVAGVVNEKELISLLEPVMHNAVYNALKNVKKGKK